MVVNLDRRISTEVSTEEGLAGFEAFFKGFLDYLRAELDPRVKLGDYVVEDGIVQPSRFHGFIDNATVYMPHMFLWWQLGWTEVGKLMRMEHPPDRRLSVCYDGLIPKNEKLGSTSITFFSEEHFSSYEGEGSRFKPEEVPFPFSEPPYNS